MAHQEPYFGELSVENNATETTIAVAGTWVQFLGFDTAGSVNLMTASTDNDDITAPFTEVCFIAISISCEANDAGGNAMYEFQLRKNNGATLFANVKGKRSIDGGAPNLDLGSITLSGIIPVIAGDTLELWVRNTSNTRNILITDCTATAHRVG